MASFLRIVSALTAACSLARQANGQQQPRSFQVGQAVKTTSGTIIGHRAQNATQVSEYLGIPFAQPPIGNLRFAPPQPYTGTDTINATNFGHDCPSMSAAVPGFLAPHLLNILSQLGQVGDDQQEDCLYVNAWSKPQTGSQPKPVLVWIYGGGFNTGGTNTSAYSGQFWADTEDLVFFNFNYRLNIFGFPGAPNLEQNVGLLDQRMALEWVRQNAAAFGGDPDRIIVFGQSAGGASVDLYNYAYADDPIVAGSISQSGTANSFGNLLPDTASKSWFQTAAKAGCNSTNADDVLTCMRSPNVTMEDLLQDESTGGGGLQSVMGIFGPTIDNKTVFYNYSDRALQGKFIQKPYLFGNNYFEAGLFELVGAASGLILPQSEWEAFDAGEFTCPESTAAIFRSAAGLPTWRYIYKADFPNEVLPTDNGEAWHGAEVLPMFGSSEAITKEDSTWQERAMGGYMRGAWSAFAHDPVNGLNIYGWQQYSNTTTSLIQLGFDNTSSTTFSVYPTYNTTEAYDGSCGNFPYGGAANR